MDIYEIVDHVVDLLRRRGRASYRSLQLRFDLDDAGLEALKEELSYTHGTDICADGPGLVWTGGPVAAPTRVAESHETPSRGIESAAALPGQNAERRQLTVLFCDLVESTALSGRLDPEEFREVVLAYQDTCAKVIARYEGHIGNYLGDGLLVYFGYPRAHEDDAQRAVRAGLGIIEAMGRLNAGLSEQRGVSLDVRLGCDTGLVVVDDISGGERHDQQAFGETLNVAARLEGIAEPNTLVIGHLTHQLLRGLFTCEPLGAPALKGVARPLEVYRVLCESTARTRLEALGAGLTPLVGREAELALLQDRWARAAAGRGHVVLLSGEAGIGKSRLVHALAEYAAAQSDAWLTPCQCSPHYRHSALHPLIDLLERVVLRLEPDESALDKLRKLEGFLVQTGQPLQDSVPLFAELLGIPLGDGYCTPAMASEEQRRQTMHALLRVLLSRAAQQPLLFVVEDLHWADPTTLEFLGMLIDRIADTRILAVFAYRDEFSPPFAESSDVTAVHLTRLTQDEAADLASRVALGKTLLEAILAQIVAKTDGVPLFIEELTNMLVESRLLEEHAEPYDLGARLPPLAIPDTLHESLMARLDRMAAVKSLAQLAATLGREFSYPLLRAVAPWDEKTVRRALDELVAAEFIHQEGQSARATYRFKHALIRDAAYQSLLKSSRQQHHQRIADVLETQFAETVSTRPELLAHHYTEAGSAARALPYWQAAGQRALERSANHEAIAHVGRGLELLEALPETEEHARRELALHIMLGAALASTQGPQTTGAVYARACELARRFGETSELFPALWGNWYVHMAQGHAAQARALAEEYLATAKQQHDPVILTAGHRMVANIAWWQGDFADALTHCRRGQALYDPEQLRTSAVSYGQDAGINCGYLEALTLWVLGYPDESVRKMDETLSHARELEHPFTVAQTLNFSAHLRQLVRDSRTAREHADEALRICAAGGFKAYGGWSLLPRGWALAEQGSAAEGLDDIREAAESRQAMKVGGVMPWFVALLGETYGRLGRFEEGLRTLEEALMWVERTGEHMYEAEVYRLKGELLVGQNVADPAQPRACFERALTIATRQRAKSWQLRAATSLGRLLCRQGKRDQAREVLEPVYDWFSEGTDTPDLRDARAVLNALD
ncbi:AAA family ATPase [Mycobacterium sp. Y57]|uniref:ATP-binding protein n=1 Tax=Mycolicibacterium xanthum TaxID=2796469 RepID=UPI001C84ABF5|nr:AAA family ATPase [Mycolicibacterium xanthum]MBX7434907.1 AAA family ATPase [Mycolicibacterium xanthum]